MDIHSATSTPELTADVNKPVLSLCIPTYNRRDKLARLLNGIQQDLKDAAGKIEICISDNASTDGTNELLIELSAHKYIRTIRQSENLGFRRNYTAVFSMARGNYIWTLGDDDIIIENRLKNLLQLLQNESPGYVYVHIASADSDLPNYFQHIKPGKYPVSILYSMLCNEGMDMFGFIGSHIFPRYSYKILTNGDEMITSGWPHLAILLATSDNLESFLVTAPLARQISDGLVWSSTNWVLVNMKKIDILGAYKPKWANKNLKFFSLTKETILSRNSIMNLLNAKIVEPERFSEIVNKAYYYFKISRGTLKFTIFMYLILIFAIKYLPVSYMLKFFKPAYYRNKMTEYETLQREKSSLEGYSREPSKDIIETSLAD